MCSHEILEDITYVIEDEIMESLIVLLLRLKVTLNDYCLSLRLVIDNLFAISCRISDLSLRIWSS